MANSNGWASIWNRFRSLGTQGACILIDALFLVIWAATQFLIHFILQKLKIPASDQWVLTTFKCIFAVATVVPVCVFLGTDVAVIFIRAGKRVKQVFKQPLPEAVAPIPDTPRMAADGEEEKGPLMEDQTAGSGESNE